MDSEAVKQLLQEKFGENCVIAEDKRSPQTIWQVPTELLPEICFFLQQNPQTYFDFLSCITGIDNGKEAGTMEVIYHLYSIPYQHWVVLKVIVPRNAENEPLPQVPTISHIWKAADWHEREIFDLLGIHFTNHPDLRRILLPADWQGHPLRKDYTAQENYHGIRVKY